MSGRDAYDQIHGREDNNITEQSGFLNDGSYNVSVPPDDEHPSRCLRLKNLCDCQKCQAYTKNYCKEAFSKENLLKKIPFIKWLPKYRPKTLQGDLIAGLTVGLMVIPQGLAYGIVAELPPQYGLYSAFMGCFIYTFLGTAKDITLGPTAIMSLMTAAFASVPQDRPDLKNDATTAIVLCLFTGLVQLVMGFLHLGFLVRFISHPVISGFTSAAAITIAIGQLKHILGLKNIPREFMHMVEALIMHIPETNYWDLILGVVCMILLILMKKMREIKWRENLGGAMKVLKYIVWLSSIARNAIIVIIASGVTYGLEIHGHRVFTLTGNITEGLPKFEAPSFNVYNATGSNIYSAGEIFGRIGAGFAIVPLLSIVETIAIGKAFARKNNYKIRPSQELIAIGVSNIVGSFVSSYPITGSFSRTAVNSQSGVKTPAGGIFTGLLVVLALAFLTPMFYFIPKSALAAVIIAAVLQMVDFGIVKKIWHINKMDIIPWFITFVLSFILGIEYGILVGIGVSLVILLFPMGKPRIRKVKDQDAVIIQFDSGLFFPAVDFVHAQMVAEGLNDSPPKSVILDCSHVSNFDFSTVEGLKDIVDDFKKKHVYLVVACLQPKAKKTFLKENIEYIQVADTIDEAIKMIQDSANVNGSLSDPALPEKTPPSTADDVNNDDEDDVKDKDTEMAKL